MERRTKADKSSLFMRTEVKNMRTGHGWPSKAV